MTTTLPREVRLELIAGAALGVAERRGLAMVTHMRVARACDVTISRSTIYRLIPTKLELLKLVAAQARKKKAGGVIAQAEQMGL